VQLPPFAIIYGLAGIASGLWFSRASSSAVLRALSGVVFAIAVLNGYVEEWVNLRRVRFDYSALFMVVIFAWPYAALCVQLMKQLGINKRSSAEWYSYLPIVYLLLVSLAVASPGLSKLENPPLSLYIFVAFICVLHVPAFATGRSQLAKLQRDGQVFQLGDVGLSRSIIRRGLVCLAVPLLISVIVQVATLDDWRLFCSNAVITAAIASLFIISRE